MKNKLKNILFKDVDESLEKRFISYHLENLNVYERFKELSEEMMKTGRGRYSAWTIINIIRLERDIRSSSKIFKINNDFISLYARLLIFNHPEFSGFFHLRSMKQANSKTSFEEKSRTVKQVLKKNQEWRV